MESIEEILLNITKPDEVARSAAQRRWDSLAKPLGSLGLLETAVTDIAALRGDAELRLDRRTLLVFCADNGVVRQGVTQCGSEVTAHVAVALAEGRSSVSPMADVAKCEVLPVDMGILDFPGHPGVLDLRVQNGTGDISLGPAMSRESCLRALESGAALACRLAEEGTDILLIGEMGIGNTTTAAAVTAALLKLPPEAVAGRGAGLSDAGLARKRAVISRALSLNAADASDPIDVLAKLGGLDLAAMCGAFLGAAEARIPAVIDGFISAAAALCAARLCPAARSAMLASHLSAEPAALAVQQALSLKAPISAGLRLGEGSGAVALLPLLDLALAVYHSGQTFDKLGIAAYEPQDKTPC